MSLLKVKWGGNERLVKYNPNKVTIGGRTYPTVKIGNQIWMAENLDLKWEGLPIGSSVSSSHRANYYNNDEATYGWNGHKCGLLYNSASLSELTGLLSDGWHIPSVSEWNELIASTQDTSNAALLVSNGNLSWAPSWTGSNMFGFNMIPSGQRYDSGTFWGSGVNAMFWTNSNRSAIYRNYTSSTSTLDSKFSTLEVSTNAQYSIRLVKDAS